MAPRQRGVDLSHWQGEHGLSNTQWAHLARCKVRFAILKATQGTGYVDPSFATNLRRARRHGIEVGAYHFLQRGSAVKQAQHFMRTVRAANGGNLDKLLLVADVERVPTPTPADDPDWRTVKAFANMLERRAPRVTRFCYSSASYWRSIGNPDGASVFDGLWQARWDGKRHTCTAVNLPAKPPRAGFGGWGRRPRMWQYGLFRYGRHRMDGNAYYGTLKELRVLFRKERIVRPLEERPRYISGYETTVREVALSLPDLVVPGPGSRAWEAGEQEARKDIAEALAALRLTTP